MTTPPLLRFKIFIFITVPAVIHITSPHRLSATPASFPFNLRHFTNYAVSVVFRSPDSLFYLWREHRMDYRCWLTLFYRRIFPCRKNNEDTVSLYRCDSHDFVPLDFFWAYITKFCLSWNQKNRAKSFINFAQFFTLELSVCYRPQQGQTGLIWPFSIYASVMFLYPSSFSRDMVLNPGRSDSITETFGGTYLVNVYSFPQLLHRVSIIWNPHDRHSVILLLLPCPLLIALPQIGHVSCFLSDAIICSSSILVYLR